ncbi:heme oxygenase (biliverdin-producing) [Solwaraspora sp. WMMB335]|uniref:biliverdin-producing heme oxygenase n=1 Tax=Solwaraspora sp. WMMB335 TaxID=3404118 RepID=UPI003B949CCC
MTNSTSPTLSHLIGEALAGAHRRSGRWRYLDTLLAGNLPVSAFKEFVTQRYFIYQAFEETADLVRADPVAAQFLFPELERLAPVRRDLAFYYGPEWMEQVRPYDVTAEHCGWIRRLAGEWPAGYIAQHHVRYIGDLAGGQVFRNKMTEHQGLVGPGIEFYDFADITDVSGFRRRYNTLLDTAPWDDDERHRIAAEAARAFEQTNALFTALAEQTLDRV